MLSHRAFLPLVLLSVVPAEAQETSPRAVLYTLTEESTYQEGCFAPCECPIMEQAPLRGKFNLKQAGYDPLYTYYDVRYVEWTAHLVSGTERQIIGSGQYRIGGEVALMHQMSLDLTVDGEDEQHFDSGLVSGGGSFPAIDITVSINGMYCWDTVLDIHAKPAPTLWVSDTDLAWDAVPGMTVYDVVRGDLGALHATSGDFAVATAGCLADDQLADTLPYGAEPVPGQGFWFVLRPVSNDTSGTYDEGYTSQDGSRDVEIGASGRGCS